MHVPGVFIDKTKLSCMHPVRIHHANFLTAGPALEAHNLLQNRQNP